MSEIEEALAARLRKNLPGVPVYRASPPTLTEFLLARIAEDEQAANSARPHEHLNRRDDGRIKTAERGGYVTCSITSGRVLAECAAKRRIVTAHADRDDMISRWYLGVLASPYADHPDYRDEWKP